METYFLCDPLSLVPSLPPRPGPSALKVLVEVPIQSAVIEKIVKMTVLEAVRFKFGEGVYQACLGAGPIPIQKRTDVKEQLPTEDRTAKDGSRVWFINDADDHYKYFNGP